MHAIYWAPTSSYFSFSLKLLDIIYKTQVIYISSSEYIKLTTHIDYNIPIKRLITFEQQIYLRHLLVHFDTSMTDLSNLDSLIGFLQSLFAKTFLLLSTF